MVSQKLFGRLPDGRDVQIFRIRAQGGRYAEILSYGATLQAVVVPDRHGNLADITQGFDSLEGHLKYSSYQGQIVGRYANRIGSGGFTLNADFFSLPADKNGVFLHSGGEFSHALWEAEIAGTQSVALKCESPDGAFGFPGTVNVTVVYTFDGDSLVIEYSATTDKPTVMNFTNHSYWNLSGTGSILTHLLQADAEFYQPVNSLLLPEGAPSHVEGTPFDFRAFKAIGQDIGADNRQLCEAGGYDHHFYLNKNGCVKVVEPESGRTLTMTTEKPGFQFYSGNFLDGKPGKGGVSLTKNSGFCLETQFAPNTPNKSKDCVFAPERPYRFKTVYSFGF